MTKQEKIIVSAYTGVLMCDLDDVYEYIQKKLGRPVFTHELANKDIQKEIEEKSKEDFLEVCGREEPEQRWIPRSERLPNHDEYIKNNGLFIVSDGNRSYSEWYDIYDKRKFGEPTMSGFRIDYAVTAWMPLPEPYQGGGSE